MSILFTDATSPANAGSPARGKSRAIAFGVRLGPLGRPDQRRLLAVPRREDQRAAGVPSLLQQLADRAHLLEHRDLARHGIVRAVDPGVVVVAAHDPRVGRAGAGDLADDVDAGA
jgi:hypothetical protein